MPEVLPRHSRPHLSVWMGGGIDLETIAAGCDDSGHATPERGSAIRPQKNLQGPQDGESLGAHVLPLQNREGPA